MVKNIRKHLENYIEQVSFITGSIGDLVEELEKHEMAGEEILGPWEWELLNDTEDNIGKAIVQLDELYNRLEEKT